MSQQEKQVVVVVELPKPLTEAEQAQLKYKIGKARSDLVLDYTPLLSNVALKVPIEPARWLPTAATDGQTIWYNERFMLGLSQEEVLFVFAHEVLHIILKHPFRRGHRDPEKWNIACDQAVNALGTELGLTAPNGCIPGIPEKSVEELYDKLPENPKGGRKGQKGDPGGFGAVIDPQGGEVDPDEGPSSGTTLVPGSAAWEAANAEADVIIKAAAEVAKMAGKLPAGMERLLDKVTEPTVPWTDLLARLIGRLSRHDYNWGLPNRRFWSQDMWMPSLLSPSIGRVAVGIDTSGSMSQADLTEAVSELFGIMQVYAQRGVPPELDVIWCDTKPIHQVITNAGDLMKPVGGGGTSFAPAFDYIRKEGMQPQLVVYMTDGWCDDFGKPTEAPVIWVVTRHGDKKFKPPFGTVLHVDPARE